MKSILFYSVYTLCFISTLHSSDETLKKQKKEYKECVDWLDTTSKILLINGRLEEAISSADDIARLHTMRQRVEQSFDAALERAEALEIIKINVSSAKKRNSY